jgi:spore germination protein KB
VNLLKQDRITPNQLFCFFTLFYYSTIVGFTANHLIQMAQYDVLFVLCIGSLVGNIYAYFTLMLAKRRPDEFLFHYGKEIIPYWIHIGLMGILIFFCFHLGAVILREYEDFIVQTYLPTTPNWAVGTMFMIVVALTVRLGISTLFRVAQGLFFLILFSDIINTIFISRELKWDRWMAFITNHSVNGIANGSYFIFPLFGEIFIMLFLFPYFKEINKTFKAISGAIWFSLILLLSSLSCILLLFGPNLASHLTYPMLDMVRYFRIADFIENLDPFLIAIWSTSIYLKISILFYVSVLVMAQFFRLKDFRPFTYSLAAVMVAMSVQMSEGSAGIIRLFKESWPTFALVVEAIPFLYLLIDTIKQYFKKKL